jgi:hypothetical protein
MAFRSFIRRRPSLATHLSEPKRAKTGFFRLLVMILIMGVWPSIATIITLCVVRQSSPIFLPWPGWAAVHTHFPDVLSLPDLPFSLTSSIKFMQLVILWMTISNSYLCFAFHICREEVLDSIRDAWSLLKLKLSRRHDPALPSP